jgi:small subunit ribosomal protein S1
MMTAERLSANKSYIGSELNSISMAEMFEDYLTQRHFEQGEIVSGLVVQVSQCDIIVDIGAKCEGVVPEYDLARLSPEDRATIQEGEEVMVYVVSTDDETDSIVLSLSRARVAQDWKEAQRLLKTQEIVECTVAGCNRGGVIVHLGHLRGFVPGSQLDTPREFDQHAASDDDNRWAALIDTSLRLKVIEVDQTRNRLILSERAALRDWRKNQRERLLNELAEGEVRTGRVINLADFGAFVDIGGVDGLVHLSELSWKRVSHPVEVLSVGQEIEVYVLGVDRERQRVALSLKRLEPDPWASIEDRYQEGQLIEGKITRLTKWGAFARIVGDEAIEGLIHISELDESPVIHPRDVIEAGQVVTLRVINVDAGRHRMALSLRQVAQGEYLDQDWQAMLETQQTAPETALSVALADLSHPMDGSQGTEEIAAGAEAGEP